MVSFDFLYVPVDRVHPLWPRLSPHIESALSHSAGEYHPDDLRDRALCARAQLWAALCDGRIMGAACTQISEYPRKRILYVLALAGQDFDSWCHLAVSASAAFAAREGCELIRINGRPGWARRLLEHGYKERYRQVEVKVQDR